MLNETAAAELGLSCPVVGNPDLYGLGIRIGIYIQMLTVQLSGLLSASFQVEDHIGQGTIVFVLSTSIVLVRLLHSTIQGLEHQAPIEPVEVFPVLTLLLIQVGVCRVSSRNKTTMLMWIVELVGLSVLFAWFWWHGMDLLPRSCPDDKAFFFTQVSIWNWFRSLNKAGSVFAAIGTAVAVFVYCGSFIYYCAVAVVGCIQKRRDISEAADDDEDDERSLSAGTVDLVVNVGAIVYVEVSLKWNNIAGVHSLNSPGQFMPFFVALGQLLSVFYSATKYLLLLHANEDVAEEEDESTLECHHEKSQHRRPRGQEDVPIELDARSA
ncbi:hypothetical protein TOPH_02089 [Tolypocladium ophioglossoides CBS 100239]|uniref:Uncharacterized protein n=1 Tax=Tolypocladium ophioglossoides (strain CBS 100239) TaxID=1163406 RepID=A0A0L0NG35_TOLOC|nr:hypothetical protein TOPH_02089 [Tolypocladium ophioglossoides CBS 100239]